MKDIVAFLQSKMEEVTRNTEAFFADPCRNLNLHRGLYDLDGLNVCRDCGALIIPECTCCDEVIL